ncbi:CCD42 protein, partial [Heliornis fulica]|nr:CCD42 protein [Heliornis fulica]
MAFDLDAHLRSAFQDKLQTHGRPVPVWDSMTTLLPSSRLILKRREAMEVERVLQSQREEFQQRMERLVERRQQLGRREEQLRDVSSKFNDFCKVPRRELGAAREEQARVSAAKVARMRRELERLLKRRERLARRLRGFGFGDYQAVLDRRGQFQDIQAMVAHFGVLVGAWATLAQETEAGQEQLAQARARLRRYEDDSELLRTEAELAQLRAQLEAAHREVLQEESCWAHIQSTANQKTMLLGHIKLAVQNLFHLANTWLKFSTNVALEDTEAQLDMVLFCMQNLADICADL